MQMMDLSRHKKLVSSRIDGETFQYENFKQSLIKLISEIYSWT